MNRFISSLTGAFLIVTCALSFYSCEDVHTQQDIYGAWEGECRGADIHFTFNHDGTCNLVFLDIASGSIKTISGNFVVDFTKKPIPLSITNIPQLSHPLHTIVEFAGEDSMRIAQFATRWRLRPIVFDRQTSFELKRVNEAKTAPPS